MVILYYLALGLSFDFCLLVIPCTICLLSPHHCTGTKQSKGACMTYFGKSALLWSFLNRDASLEKNSLMGWPFCQQKCYLTWLRGAEEGQRRASIGHLEVLTNFGWAREVQDLQKRQNRSTYDEQQGDRTCIAEVLEMSNWGLAVVLQWTESTLLKIMFTFIFKFIWQLPVGKIVNLNSNENFLTVWNCFCIAQYIELAKTRLKLAVVN